MIVNAGNANVFRGAEGDAAVRAEAEAVAAALGCPPEEVFVASTGVIGERLPVEKITGRVADLAAGLRADGIEAAARRDHDHRHLPQGCRRPRAEIDGVPVTIAGIAKGSGMIAPDMATMLAFVVTDAALPAAVLQPLLAEATDASFNAITVDSDTSTSDTLLLLATGAARHGAVRGAGRPAARRLPRGAATRCCSIWRIRSCATARVRRSSSRSRSRVPSTPARRGGSGSPIANSPLVKTAIAGGDANWGRVIMAVGKSGEPVDMARLGVAFGGHDVARDGAAVPDLDEAPVAAHLAGSEIAIRVVVGDGPGAATVWTCDLTHGYIDINADYRS